jgi:uncharacterized surface protein with fasciclin (FAS1) repeats
MTIFKKDRSIRRTLWYALIGLFLFGSCKKGFNNYWFQENPKGGFLYDKIKSNSEFSIFAQGLERTQLSTFISSGGLYTVFAPTNAAFQKYLTLNGFASINDVPIEKLFTILSYHIVNNMWYYYDLKVRYASAYKQRLYLTRNKKFVNIDVTVDNTIKVNGILVENSLRDIDAENGVIHGISELLVPLANLEEVMQSDPDLSGSTFYKLMQVLADRQYDRFNTYDKDRDGRLDSAFYKTYPLIDNANLAIEYKVNQNVDSQGGDPVFTTILVPRNAELDANIASVLANFGGKIESLPPSYIESVLENYFYADTTMLASAIINRNVQPKSVNGLSMVSTALKSDASFVRKDIKASNGVIHIINSTFGPSDRQMSALGQAMTDPSLTMFMAALQKSGLMGTYASSTKAATFFAPTNSAFVAANVDITKMTINGAVLTTTQFSDFVKTHIIPSNRIQTTLTGTISTDASNQPLTFSNNGTTVTSPSGEVATISYPAIAIGPSNTGYVYKVNKLLLFK